MRIPMAARGALLLLLLAALLLDGSTGAARAAQQATSLRLGAEAGDQCGSRTSRAGSGGAEEQSAAGFPLQRITEEKLKAVRERLLPWLRANHAEVNVEVREANPGAGLALYAVRPIPRGGTILSLPTDLGFRRRTQHGVMDFLLDYVLDLHNPSSPRAAMWATAPRPAELRHLLNFPPAYLPLLQHPQLEAWIGEGLTHDVRVFCRIHTQELAAAGLDCGDAVHALGLVGTRTFSKPEADGSDTYFALPLLDMANHRNTCPHGNMFGPCVFDSSRECVSLHAGEDLDEGQEVCFFYGHLLADRALLEYGFLPGAEAAAGGGGSAAPELSGIDRHDARPDEQPLAKLLEAPAAFAGRTTAEVAARVEELQQLLARLEAGDARAAGITAQGPAPSDEDGWFLGQLLEWRQQRQAAIRGEIARLQQQLVQQ